MHTSHINLHLCTHTPHVEHMSSCSSQLEAPPPSPLSISLLLMCSDGGSWIRALCTTTLSDLTWCSKTGGFDVVLSSFLWTSLSFWPSKCANGLSVPRSVHTLQDFPSTDTSSLNAFSRSKSLGCDCHKPQNWSVQSFRRSSRVHYKWMGTYPLLTCLAGSIILILFVTGPPDDMIGPWLARLSPTTGLRAMR